MKNCACDNCAGFREDVHPLRQHPVLHKVPLHTRQMYEVQELKVVCQRRTYRAGDWEKGGRCTDF